MPERSQQAIWWIASARDEEWAGLRIAFFFRAAGGGEELVVITGEIDQRRVGVRDWQDIEEREGWRKITQITPPTDGQIAAAFQD